MLYLKDFQIDIVYRRVIFNELLSRKHDVRDFLRAYCSVEVAYL